MATMRALRAHTRGGPEVLVYESAPRPTAKDGELLIAVHAAAITFAELTWPETWSSDGVDRTPIVPSHEFSGVVAEVGEGVARGRCRAARAHRTGGACGACGPQGRGSRAGARQRRWRRRVRHPAGRFVGCTCHGHGPHQG